MWKWMSSPLKSFGKKIAIWGLRRESQTLRLLVHNTLEKEGPKAIDRNFDAFQAKVIKLVIGIGFLPQSIKDNICKGVQLYGDDAQIKVKEAFERGGILAVDHVFEMFLQLAEEKIASL